jgi:hypothetical protein
MTFHMILPRAAALTLVGVALSLCSACSTLQQMGTPVGGTSSLGGSHVRGGAMAHYGDTSRDHVDQILEERAPQLGDETRQRVIDALFTAKEEHGFDPLMLLAVMQVESGFNPSARSSQGALGLMQVQPFSGKLMAKDLGIRWQGPSTLLDPEKNVRIGIAYLAYMYETFKDLELSLAAYNVGPGRLQEILASGSQPAGIYSGKVKSKLADIASASGLRP